MSFDPNLFVAKWYCSLIGPEDMPSFAADALEAGFDGPALRRLAGLVSPTSRDVGNLFDRALGEIGNVDAAKSRVFSSSPRFLPGRLSMGGSTQFWERKA